MVETVIPTPAVRAHGRGGGAQRKDGSEGP
jgi:hypothetical protein